MTMRALAPSGVPFTVADIVHGLLAGLDGERGTARFCEQINRRFGQKHVFLYSSGRGAISAGLHAVHQLNPDRDEVLIPAYTSFSVPSAVVQAGFKVRLYDVDPQTMSPDLESLEAAVSDKSLCILVCHLFGCSADMDPVEAIADKHGVLLFDDAAQSMGATYNGREVGTMGDLGLYSLSRGKNISAVDGGILVTNDDKLAAELAEAIPPQPSAKGVIKLGIMALALCFLMHPRLYWIPNSLPFLKLGESHFDPDFEVTGLTAFQAGLGARMLRRLERINLSRKAIAKKWMARLTGRTFPTLIEGSESVWLRLPLLDSSTDMARTEFGVVPSYPTGLHEIKGLKPYLAGDGEFPGAEQIARSLVTLPTQGYVTDEDIEHMARVLGDGEDA